MVIRIILIISLCFSFVACAPPLQVKPNEVTQVSSNEGIALGSIKILLRDEKVRFARSLENLTWYVKIRSLETYSGSKVQRSIYVKSDGAEVPFVTLLPAGRYEIQAFYEQGMQPNIVAPININFDVSPAVKTYIGRLIVTLPKEVGVFDNLLFKERSLIVTVEDDQEHLESVLAKNYQDFTTGDIKKALMYDKKVKN